MNRLTTEQIDILSRDHAKNHAHRAYSVENQVEQLETAMKGPVFLKQVDNCMFIHQVDDEYSIEFHSINGGGGKDLTSALNKFLDEMSEVYSFANTYFDNPKILELSKYCKFPSSFSRISRGIDKEYQMTFDLRGDK